MVGMLHGGFINAQNGVCTCNSNQSDPHLVSTYGAKDLARTNEELALVMLCDDAEPGNSDPSALLSGPLSTDLPKHIYNESVHGTAYNKSTE